MSFKKILGAVAAISLLAGCASVAVNEDALTQRTSLSLGLAPNQFTISNRIDSGVRTDYSVRTSAGRVYACYVAGTVSVMGRMVSDALCTEMQSGDARGKTPVAPQANCNALLKAAGKCS